MLACVHVEKEREKERVERKRGRVIEKVCVRACMCVRRRVKTWSSHLTHTSMTQQLLVNVETLFYIGDDGCICFKFIIVPYMASTECIMFVNEKGSERAGESRREREREWERGRERDIYSWHFQASHEVELLMMQLSAGWPSCLRASFITGQTIVQYFYHKTVA